MLSTSFRQEYLNFDLRRFQAVSSFTSSIQGSEQTLKIFTVPLQYKFYATEFWFFNLSTGVQLSAKFTASGSEYQAARTQVFSAAVAANSLRQLAIQAQTTTRIWQQPGTDFNMGWTSSAGSSVIKVYVNGFLVQDNPEVTIFEPIEYPPE